MRGLVCYAVVSYGMAGNRDLGMGRFKVSRSQDLGYLVGELYPCGAAHQQCSIYAYNLPYMPHTTIGH
jgi:hypothetical protein